MTEKLDLGKMPYEEQYEKAVGEFTLKQQEDDQFDDYVYENIFMTIVFQWT